MVAVVVIGLATIAEGVGTLAGIAPSPGKKAVVEVVVEEEEAVKIAPATSAGRLGIW